MSFKFFEEIERAMELFFDSFGEIILMAFVTFGLIFATWKYPLPKDLRSGSMWQQAGKYEQFLPGWKGKAIKYIWRAAIVGTVFILALNFLATVSKRY